MTRHAAILGEPNPSEGVGTPSWYVNGTLDDQERRAVECTLAALARPSWRNVTTWPRSSATEVPAWSPAPDRLSRLLSRIDAAEARHAWASRWWKTACSGWRTHGWRRTPPRALGVGGADGADSVVAGTTVLAVGDHADIVLPHASRRQCQPPDRVRIRIVSPTT
jgi:hypothetical protein